MSIPCAAQFVIANRDGRLADGWDTVWRGMIVPQVGSMLARQRHLDDVLIHLTRGCRETSDRVLRESAWLVVFATTTWARDRAIC